jgi:hypothetical protein
MRKQSILCDLRRGLILFLKLRNNSEVKNRLDIEKGACMNAHSLQVFFLSIQHETNPQACIHTAARIRTRDPQTNTVHVVCLIFRHSCI